MMGRALAGLLCGACAAWLWAGAGAGLAQTAGADDPVIATVEGLTIHRSDFARAFRRLPREMRDRGVEAVYPAVLERLIEQRLTTRRAREAGLADDPEVAARLELLRDQVMHDVYVDRLLAERVTRAKLDEVYREFVEMNPPFDMIRARHVLVETEAEAREIVALVLEGQPFAELARVHSTAPSAPEGGDLGWFRKEEMLPGVAEAAFRLEANQFTADPVASEYGWHVILVEERRTVAPPDFDTVRPRLEELLIAREMDALMRALVADAAIRRYTLDGEPMDAPAR